MTDKQYEFFVYCKTLLEHHAKLADGEWQEKTTVELREKMKAQEALLTSTQQECANKISQALFRGCAEK